MENQKTAEAIKAIAIPDRKSLDRFGNPTKWILKVSEPHELCWLIAFPKGFEVKPGVVYVADVGRNYAIAQLHNGKRYGAKKTPIPSK